MELIEQLLRKYEHAQLCCIYEFSHQEETEVRELYRYLNNTARALGLEGVRFIPEDYVCMMLRDYQ